MNECLSIGVRAVDVMEEIVSNIYIVFMYVKYSKGKYLPYIVLG